MLVARRDHDRYEEKLDELEKTEKGLSTKIGSIEDKEKTADEIIGNTKKNL